MRTKLDEIVESIFGTDEKPVFYPDSARKAVMAACEASFRHGVEQLNEANRVKAEMLRLGRFDVISLDSIQPAPAEEECPGCLDDMKWHRAGCPVKDRRKGQRRKGREVVQAIGTYLGTFSEKRWFFPEWKPGSLSCPERREKDRRKP